MNKSFSKLMSQEWEYDISRNVQFWHDELSIKYNQEGFKRLKLPNFYNLRIHRGIHADFYYHNQGVGNKEILRRALIRNFKSKKYIKFLIKEYYKKGQEFIRLSKKLTADPKHLKKFFKFYGILTPMLDTTATASKIITDLILKKLQGNKYASEIFAYYTNPRVLAPIQKMEKEIADSYGKKINKLELAKKLHNKYCWIPISFMGEPWNLKFFHNEIINYKPRQREKVKKPEANISKEVLYYLELLGEIAHLNEYRKSFFTQGNYYIRPLMDKIARKYKIGTWKELSMLTTEEILDLFKGRDSYQSSIIKSRQKPWMMYAKGESGVGYLYGDEVLKFEKKFMPKVEGLKQVSGTIANKGVIKGTVKLIYKPSDFSKFKKNDILIAKMTSVDFIPIMKKAGAFVTNEGGLACHAAIISREYDKPCIIGTKIATDVFKDGDKVLVDANKGIVKKI